MNVYELNEPIACDLCGETVSLARKSSSCVRQCIATAIEPDRLRAETPKLQAKAIVATKEGYDQPGVF